MAYGLYIHIPYCRSRCRYCDFYTKGACRSVPQNYIRALVQSFLQHAPKGPNGRPLPPATVYFGGGTPGLLTGAQVKELLAAFAPVPGAEITLETNPELAQPDTLRAWHSAGINRLSLGVQTASDESLRRLGRLHTASDAKQALQNARQAGFANICGDIMLALPGYTKEEFDATLHLLCAGGATHISAYLLKIEPGTPFGKTPPAHLPTEDEAAQLYLYAAGQLQKAGYERYEISNFARPGFAGRHNLVYWNCEDYLGLGPAAHSCLGGQRYRFEGNTGAFIEGALPMQPESPCTQEDYIMLQLRLAGGLDESVLKKRFGAVLNGNQTDFLSQLCTRGLACKTAGGYVLTGEGMLVQNAILARLLP